MRQSMLHDWPSDLVLASGLHSVLHKATLNPYLYLSHYSLSLLTLSYTFSVSVNSILHLLKLASIRSVLIIPDYGPLRELCNCLSLSHTLPS